MYFKKRKIGFTLIEVVLSIGIIILIFSLVVPTGISFYRSQQLESTATKIVQILRQAQQKAWAQADNNFGVYLTTGKVVLFQGESYISRENEEETDILQDISFSGVLEIVFSKEQGEPINFGDVIFSLDEQEKTINVNPVGRINLETEN